VHKRTGDRCFFYVTDVFAVSKCQVSTGLAYVCPVACFTCQFVYAAFVVVLHCVAGPRQKFLTYKLLRYYMPRLL